MATTSWNGASRCALSVPSAHWAAASWFHLVRVSPPPLPHPSAHLAPTIITQGAPGDWSQARGGCAHWRAQRRAGARLRAQDGLTPANSLWLPGVTEGSSPPHCPKPGPRSRVRCAPKPCLAHRRPPLSICEMNEWLGQLTYDSGLGWAQTSFTSAGLCRWSSLLTSQSPPVPFAAPLPSL